MQDIEMSRASASLTRDGEVRSYGRTPEWIIGLLVFMSCLTIIAFVLAVYAVATKNTDNNQTALSYAATTTGMVSQLSPIPSTGYSYGNSFDAGSGSWSFRDSMTSDGKPSETGTILARSDHGAVLVGPYKPTPSTSSATTTQVIVFGGLIANEVPTDITTTFDPVTENQGLLKAMQTPVGRFGFAGVDITGSPKVYAVGGVKDAAGTTVTTVQQYDVVTDAWSNKSALPNAISDLACCSVTGVLKLFCFGGLNTNFEPLNTIFIYDQSADTWTRSSTVLTSPRSDLVCASNGKLIYVIGGWAPSQADASIWIPLSVMDIYDPATNSIKVGESMNVPRGDPAAGLVNGRIVVAGGERASYDIFAKPKPQIRTAIPIHTVETYDINNNKWVIVAPLGDAMFRMPGIGYNSDPVCVGCQSYQGSLTIFGGENHCLQTAAYSFSCSKSATISSYF